jgi:hypothetical protein
MQLSLRNLFYSFFKATYFGLFEHHQAIYIIITKIIELYNGSVIVDLLYVLLPAMQYSYFPTINYLSHLLKSRF